MSEIEATHKQDIDDALHNRLGDVSWEVKWHMSQGASAATYQIDCDDKNFIARITDPNRPNANISMELHCMEQASICHFAPHLYSRNSENNLSIMECIDTKSLPFFNQGNAQDVKNLADTIVKLHSGRDLLGFNAIYAGERYYFIDWESACNESLYFNLAVETDTLLFKIPDSESLFLNAYLKNEPTQKQLGKLKLMRIFAYLFYGFVLLYLNTSIQEPSLTDKEITGLESFSKFIEQQIKENKPNVPGRFLNFGYSSFIQGMKHFETDAIQNAIKLLRKTY